MKLPKIYNELAEKGTTCGFTDLHHNMPINTKHFQHPNLCILLLHKYILGVKPTAVIRMILYSLILKQKKKM